MKGLTLRNCTFAFECPASWDGLAPTLLDKVRYCDHCGQDVHRCDTDEKLLQAVRQNLCVAIEAEDTAAPPVRRMLVGSVRARGITLDMPKLGNGDA
jgi:hypothetical protein